MNQHVRKTIRVLLLLCFLPITYLAGGWLYLYECDSIDRCERYMRSLEMGGLLVGFMFIIPAFVAYLVAIILFALLNQRMTFVKYEFVRFLIVYVCVLVVMMSPWTLDTLGLVSLK